MKPSAHLHLIVQAKLHNPPGPDSVNDIKQLMTDLVAHVRMHVLVAPSATYCTDKGNEGITSTVILSTSHSAMHIWDFPDSDEPALMQFDLYSCAAFTPEEVIQFLKDRLGIYDVAYKFLDRENGFKFLDRNDNE